MSSFCCAVSTASKEGYLVHIPQHKSYTFGLNFKNHTVPALCDEPCGEILQLLSTIRIIHFVPSHKSARCLTRTISADASLALLKRPAPIHARDRYMGWGIRGL